jgi:nucleotide-binding universal stress UspA family protein
MNVLVASDGSESAERAVEFAARLAIGFSADLVIVTVSPNVGDAGAREFSHTEDATVGDVLESTARMRLARALGIAEKTGLGAITTETRDGDPAEVILGRGGALNSAAIVVGKRGQGRLQGLLLGSVSQKLVELADRPVIVVP